MQFNSNLNRQDSILALSQATKEQKVQELLLSVTRMSPDGVCMQARDWEEREKNGCWEQLSTKVSHLVSFGILSVSIFCISFGGLNGSFYSTLICPLWDLLVLSYLGSFPHFRGNTLYIISIEDPSHFTKVLSINKMKLSWCMQMYASASVAGYAIILVRHVERIRARPNYHAARRSSKSMYDMKIKSWEGGCCTMYLEKAMEMPCR